MNYIKFRKEMRERRKELGISQGELAKSLGWKNGASEISRIETGKLRLSKEIKELIDMELVMRRLSGVPTKLEKLAVQAERDVYPRFGEPVIQVSNKTFRADIREDGSVFLGDRINNYPPTISSQEVTEVKGESYKDVYLAILLMGLIVMIMWALLSVL